MTNATQTSEKLVISRVFDAPVEKVWKAWTDPASCRQWWGPKDFTCPVAEMDVRVGGKYFNCMKAPDGKEYWGTGVYKEIVPLKRIVYSDSFSDEQGNVVPASYYGMAGDWPEVMEVTVSFEEQEGKSKMVLTHTGLPDKENKDMCEAGWNESFDKMDNLFKS
jgi:uncharacterized protein YndB with AHSA1/START domain